MTKTINEYGDLVDDYETAVEWQKNWKAPECNYGENGTNCWVCK